MTPLLMKRIPTNPMTIPRMRMNRKKMEILILGKEPIIELKNEK